MSRTFSVVLLLFALAAPNSIHAQSGVFLIPRDRVLAFDMDVAGVGPYTSPATFEHAGLVWEKTVISASEVTAIRIQVLVTPKAGLEGWTAKVTDLHGNVVDQFDLSAVGAKGRWSKAIPGAGGRVQLWAVDFHNPPVITIQQYAFAKQPSVPKAIYGKDQRQPISAATRVIQQRGKSVARLKFMTDAGEALCTGFLISGDLLVTNNHCIDTATDLSSLVAEFGFDRTSSVVDPFAASSLERTDTALDYSIIRLAGHPGAKYGHLQLAPVDPVSEKTKLVIVQHPGGEPKQVSIKDCAVLGSDKIGVQIKSDFGHTCDTLGGSSGSPVMRLSDGLVVGLHHFGFQSGDPDPVNQAVYIKNILEDIHEHLPALEGELGKD